MFSVMDKLPVTSYIRLVDIWLIFGQLIPFIEVFAKIFIITCILYFLRSYFSLWWSTLMTANLSIIMDFREEFLMINYLPKDQKVVLAWYVGVTYAS